MSLLWVTAAKVTYYHGSDDEFEPGDILRPRSETGAPSWAERVGYDGPEPPWRTDNHVYHATNTWAPEWFGRHVYEVEPLTPVERDPEDYGEGWTRSKGPVRVVRKHHSIGRNW